MNRHEILSGIPFNEGVSDEQKEEILDYLEGVVEHFQDKFLEIEEGLEIESLEDLHKIEDAYILVRNCRISLA